VFEQLKQIMTTKFQLNPADVAPEATLEGLELDSLDLVELSLVMEKELGVRISDDELAETQQLEAIIRLAESRSAKV